MRKKNANVDSPSESEKLICAKTQIRVRKRNCCHMSVEWDKPWNFLFSQYSIVKHLVKKYLFAIFLHNIFSKKILHQKYCVQNIVPKILNIESVSRPPKGPKSLGNYNKM